MARFDWFVVFASMRTGSNFLEANLNALSDVVCHGEAFNPHFIGYPKETSLLGFSQAERDENPLSLLSAIKGFDDRIGGFRYFPEHDTRVLEPILEDPRCAKIVLTRNPLYSYVSWKIAQDTGQWKLTDAKARKDGRAKFEADEFKAFVTELQSFQVTILNRLQESGQTAFYLDYDDLQNVAVINGLAAFLGSGDHLKHLDKNLKVQNPAPVTEKVSNLEDMRRGLSALDTFNLGRTPNFEPRRGPAVPTYKLSAEPPLLYMPVRGAGEEAVSAWLSALNKAELHSDLGQGDLRTWLRETPGRRSFTVVQHPLARAHSVFWRRILNFGDGGFHAIRNTLKKRYKVPLPMGAEDLTDFTQAQHEKAFSAFLEFLKANVVGQTVVRVDPSWASQTQVLQGFGEFALPDQIVRYETAGTELAELARRVGYDGALPEWTPQPMHAKHTLTEIYSDDLEKRAQAAYARDYTMFGYGDWLA